MILATKKYIYMHHIHKVATYHHVYRVEPKEPTQFVSVSVLEIQN